jgi:hypothetical protein
VVFCLASALLPTAAAQAAPPPGREFIDQRCDGVFGFCWSTSYEGTDVDLVMESADRGGRYQVCVRSPRGREACRPIKLRRRPDGPHGYAGFRNRVVFARSFRFEGAGIYGVVWKGYPLEDAISPLLQFELGADGEPRGR